MPRVKYNSKITKVTENPVWGMLDVPGMYGLFRNIFQCMMCNTEQRFIAKNECPWCVFQRKSPIEGGGVTRVGCNQKIFLEFGLQNPPEFGKHHLFWLMCHYRAGSMYPPLPDEDIMGIARGNRKTWVFHLHHINGDHWNDCPWNHGALLPTEHALWHPGIVDSDRQQEIENIKMGTYVGELANQGSKRDKVLRAILIRQKKWYEEAVKNNRSSFPTIVT